jgi:hypothetical protein
MRTFQRTPETITTIGIDLGKNTFHLVGWTGAREVCAHKQLTTRCVRRANRPSGGRWRMPTTRPGSKPWPRFGG